MFPLHEGLMHELQVALRFRQRRVIREEPFELPADKPLRLVAYEATPIKTAYVEPLAVGDALPEMPIFLTADMYVLAPLETTYMTTWSLCPQPIKDLLE
jgi:hypothetical protein